MILNSSDGIVYIYLLLVTSAVEMSSYIANIDFTYLALEESLIPLEKRDLQIAKSLMLEIVQVTHSTSQHVDLFQLYSIAKSISKRLHWFIYYSYKGIYMETK